MRMRAAATGTLIAAVLLGPLAAPAAAATLSATPDRAVAPTTITVSGSCDPLRPGSPVFPRVTTLTLDGQQSAAKPIPVARDGTFTGPVPLPSGLTPGDHVLASDCGGQTTITVLPAPTLVLDPASVRAPARVSATGTCPARSGARTELFLADRSVGTTAVDPATGEFGPFAFPVPDGLAPGRVRVTSSCDGTAVLTLQAAPVATANPAAPAVPTTSAPTAATTTAPPAGSSFPVVVVVAAGLAVLLLLALLTTLLRVRRLRRERRWLDDRVRVGATAAAWHPSGTAGPDGPGIEVDLLVQREPPEVRLEEVAGHD